MSAPSAHTATTPSASSRDTRGVHAANVVVGGVSRRGAAVSAVITNVSKLGLFSGGEDSTPETMCAAGAGDGVAAAVARALDMATRASGDNAVATRAVVHSAWRVAAVSDSVLVATRTSAARTPPRRTLARIARS